MFTARVYFEDHNTKTITWNDPHLPSTLDANVPQYKCDFHRKLIYFRPPPVMCTQAGNCQIKVWPPQCHIYGLNWHLMLGSVSVFQFLLAFLNLTCTMFEASVPALIVMSQVYLCPESLR